MSDQHKTDQIHFAHDLTHAKAGSLTHAHQSNLINKVTREFNPSPLSVFANLVGIHFFSSLLTLSVCPQFGLRILGQGHGLMAYFMPLGMIGCFTLCGLFYLAVTVGLSKFIMTRAQWRVLRQYFVISMLALSLCSLLLFSLIQGLFILHLSIAWLAGAIIGAYLFRWMPLPHRTNIIVL
jgi:hypothetical protein